MYMGTKDDFIAETDRILDEYLNEEISIDLAYQLLAGLGFSQKEADELFKECAS